MIIFIHGDVFLQKRMIVLKKSSNFIAKLSILLNQRHQDFHATFSSLLINKHLYMKKNYFCMLATILLICGTAMVLMSCGKKENAADEKEQLIENEVADEEGQQPGNEVANEKGQLPEDEAAGEKGQLLEVYNVVGSKATARLTIDGKVLFTTTVYIGKNGIGKTAEGDGKTPTGTLHVVKAFGVKAKPEGCKFEYIDVTPTTYACDEDCKWYNQIIDVAEVGHKCHGEDMYNLVPQYNYGLTTDYNAACDHSKGSNIFIHCKHTTRKLTAGCIAFDEDKMVEILRHCDTSLVVKITK